MQKITIKTEDLLLTFELEKITAESILELCKKHNIKDAKIISIKEESSQTIAVGKTKVDKFNINDFYDKIHKDVPYKSYPYKPCEVWYSIK